MASKVVQDDMGAAILAVIQANPTRFPMVAKASGVMRAEYGRQHQKHAGETRGRVLVRPGDVVPQEQQGGSALSAFSFELVFDFKDTRSRQSHQQIAMQSAMSCFADATEQVAALLVDTGSNIVGGGPGELVVTGLVEDKSEPAQDPQHVIVGLVWTIWHKTPASYP